MPGRMRGRARTAAHRPWRTAANYSDLSTRRHITRSPVGKVPYRPSLHLQYIINGTHHVRVFIYSDKFFSNKLAVNLALL